MDGSNNGLFTTYLLEGLSGGSDINSDGLITIGELYDFVYARVTEYANKIPHSQHPVIWGRFNENMPVLRIQ